MHWYTLLKQAQAIPEISPHEAQQRRLFGPVYHGTDQESREVIHQEGFRSFIGESQQGDVRNGYQKSDYSGGIPAPIHHLGFGAYFTTVKNVAKQFNYDSAAGLVGYYLDVPRLETINWGANSTMMNWWITNGYDPELAKKDRVAATVQMTNQLKSKWDAVFFKGKGLRRLLDGNQICVFEPQGKVFIMNNKLSLPGQVGSSVRRKSDGMKGKIVAVEPIGDMLSKFPGSRAWLKPETKARLRVKWQRGGLDPNVQDVDIEYL